MNTINSVKVSIAGREYNLRTDDTPEYLRETAEKLDSEIKGILKDKPSFGIQNAAVITALMATDESRKANEAIDNIRGQIKTYVADAAKARAAKDKLQDRIKALEATIELLERAVKKLEKENAELKKTQSPFSGEQLVLENTLAPAVTVYVGDDKTAEDAEKAETDEAPVSESEAESAEDVQADADDTDKETGKGDSFSIDDEIAGYLGDGQPRKKGRRKRR